MGTRGDDVLVKYTYNGDATLDGLIDADDYFRIDSGFLNQPQSPTYAQGNFNYDSVIDADDYFLIDSAFLGQGAPLTASGDLSRLSSIPIPEPTTAFTLLVLATATFARRTTSSLPPLKMPQASHPRDACVVK